MGVNAIERLRDRLNRLAVDSLDVPPVYRDGRTALDAQTAEMGEVSGWYEDCREALAAVDAL